MSCPFTLTAGLCHNFNIETCHNIFLGFLDIIAINMYMDSSYSNSQLLLYTLRHSNCILYTEVIFMTVMDEFGKSLKISIR